MDATFINCPKCGLEQPAGKECRRCGVVFARAHSDAAPAAKPRKEPAAGSQRRGRATLVLAMLAVALVGAAVVAVIMRADRAADERASGAAALSADEKAAAQAFSAYRQALVSGEPVTVRQHVVAARRAELDGAEAGQLLATISALTPAAYEVTRVQVNGDDATLSLAASFEGQPATGTALMRREDGGWLLANESWEVKLDLGGASGAPVEIVRIAALSGGERGKGLAALADRFLPAPGQRHARAFQVGPDLVPAVIATLSGHTDGVESLAFTPDGDRLVSASFGDQTLCLSRIEGTLVTCAPTEWRVADLAVSPDGSTAYTVDAYEHLLAWPLLEDGFGEPAELALTPDGERLGLDVSPNGAVVATAGGLGDHGSISLWDRGSHSLLSALEVDHALRDVAFSPDGRFLAAVGTGRAILLFDLARGAGRRYEVKGPAADSETVAVAISPDGRHLATAHNESSLSLWDLTRGRQVHDFFVKDASAMDAVFSADGTILATAQGDNAVYLWEVGSGKKLARLTGHTDTPLALAFSPDGSLLASAGRDAKILLWR